MDSFLRHKEEDCRTILKDPKKTDRRWGEIAVSVSSYPYIYKNEDYI